MTWRRTAAPIRYAFPLSVTSDDNSGHIVDECTGYDVIVDEVFVSLDSSLQTGKGHLQMAKSKALPRTPFAATIKPRTPFSRRKRLPMTCFDSASLVAVYWLIRITGLSAGNC